MARVEMITRTVDWTRFEVMALEVSTATVVNKVYTLSGHKTDDEGLKVIQKTYDTNEIKHVAINKRETGETLYGMTVQEFIQVAKILPPRK